jgi:hypothetical protein
LAITLKQAKIMFLKRKTTFTEFALALSASFLLAASSFAGI